MRELLHRKVFGKIPLPVVIIVGVIAFYLWRKKAASKNANPAAAAGSDPTSPYGFAPPDQYPTQGPAAPASQGSVGLNATDTSLISKLTAALTANTKAKATPSAKAAAPIRNPAKKISTMQIGNTPHVNAQRFANTKTATAPNVTRKPAIIKRSAATNQKIRQSNFRIQKQERTR